MVSKLTPSEEQFLKEFTTSKSRHGLQAPPAFVSDSTINGIPELKHDPRVDKELWRAQIATAIGSNQKAVQEQVMTQLYAVCAKRESDPSLEMSAVLGLMLELAPKDGIEARLATQMVCTHKVAMDLLAKGARAGESILVRDFFLRHAERLMRLFGHQMESLNRYRGKAPSEQKVTVEHVHVYEGGQAVVGNIAQSSSQRLGGRGASTEP